MKYFYIILITLTGIFQVQGQNSLKTNKHYTTWELGVMLGGSYYQGDLHDYARDGVNIADASHFAYGLYAKKYLNKSFDLRLNLYRGSISADESNFIKAPIHEDRSFSFYSPLTELSIVLDYDFLGNLRFKNDKFNQIFSPYIFGGIGIQYTDPVVDWGPNEADYLAFIATDKAQVTTTHFVLPVGLGVHYDVSPRVLLSFELGARKVFSDYLDGVSVSANTEKNDWDAIGGLHIGFKLGLSIDTDGDGVMDNNDKCPNEVGVALFDGCPDSDGDGVQDSEDDCPRNPGVIEFNGCPDSDGDGIPNKEDDCPSKAGLAEFGGCPDSDEDGIMDKNDNCPFDKGLAIHQGCPDRDGDGIPDDKDNCPKHPGLEAFKGCPDTDGDGVQDKYDRCPMEKGVPENNGCPLVDTDGDGVADLYDKCPEVKGFLSNDGCPTEEVVDGSSGSTTLPNGIKSAMERTLYFNTSSSIISASESLKVIEIIYFMKRYPEATIRLSGKADHRGRSDFNKELSRRRSEAVKNLLIQKGIDSYRITHIKALGEIKSSGQTEHELREFRAVDIQVIK